MIFKPRAQEFFNLLNFVQENVSIEKIQFYFLADIALKYFLNNKLKKRSQDQIDKIVIVTTPKVYFSTIDISKLCHDFCLI